MADIFRQLNILSTGMKAEDILTYTDKIKSIRENYIFGKENLSNEFGNMSFGLVSNTFIHKTLPIIVNI